MYTISTTLIYIQSICPCLLTFLLKTNSRNISCHVVINVVLQAVHLQFVSFDLEDISDKVSVYDGSDNTAPLLHKLSGTSRPSDVISSGNVTFVSFVTDSNATGDGFKILYSTTITAPGKTSSFL